jgi:hypothetical protein
MTANKHRLLQVQQEVTIMEGEGKCPTRLRVHIPWEQLVYFIGLDGFIPGSCGPSAGLGEGSALSLGGG